MHAASFPSARYSRFYRLAPAAILPLFIFTRPAQAADAYQVLHTFTSLDGSVPSSTLASDGITLYGTTVSGGANSTGTIFSYDTSASAFHSLHSFNNSFVSDNEQQPYGSLTLSNGILYGTNSAGGVGSNQDGTLFSFTLSTSTLTPVHAFTGFPNDGSQPHFGAPLLNGSTLYGATLGGGTSGVGTIYSFDTSTNTASLVHSFANDANGFNPEGTLVLSNNTLYGITTNGGSASGGTLFALDLSTQQLTTLHAFGQTAGDAFRPMSAPVLNGTTLYGTTTSGGAHGAGAIYAYDLLTNTESIIYSFGSIAGDGAQPQSAPLLFNDALYGTTASGGDASNRGVLYSFNLDTDTETLLHTFTGTNGDGASPSGGLTLLGGNLYGTTTAGGTSFGTVFSFAVPEPSTLLLVPSALLFLSRRRREVG